MYFILCVCLMAMIHHFATAFKVQWWSRTSTHHWKSGVQLWQLSSHDHHLTKQPETWAGLDLSFMVRSGCGFLNPQFLLDNFDLVFLKRVPVHTNIFHELKFALIWLHNSINGNSSQLSLSECLQKIFWQLSNSAVYPLIRKKEIEKKQRTRYLITFF